MYSLEILKNGLVIDTILLHEKDYYIIGRQPDICDIGLDHPSISRIHAVIQHHEDGSLMIIDMNSAHGTFLNKKELNKSEYHRLFVGDFIKFGASTRSYIVQGPDNQRPNEYDSENMKVYRQKLAQRSADLKAKKEEADSVGISWGFREDAQNYDDEDNHNHLEDKDNLPDYLKDDLNYERKFGDKFSSSIADSEVSEKDLELLEKLRKKERKIQNMQQEISRIYMKENNQENGLTAGQLAAVERNDKRIEQLKEQVESIEKTLREKKNQREASKLGVASISETKKKKNDDRDSDDERFDTTQQTMDISLNWRLKKKHNTEPSVKTSILAASSSSRYGAVSYEQLCQERDLKQSRYNTLMKDIQRYDEIIQQSLQSNDSEMDELEKYLLNSRREEAQKAKQECFQEAQVVMTNVLELEKYIQIAAPALLSLSTKDCGLTKEVKKTKDGPESRQLGEVSSPTNKPETIEEFNEDSGSNVSTEPPKAIPVKRSRHLSVMAVNNSSIPWEKPFEDVQDSSEAKKVKQEIPDQKSLPIAKSIIGPSIPNRILLQSNYSHNELEGGDTIWLPPKNQSGDGKTALNAKYGY